MGNNGGVYSDVLEIPTRRDARIVKVPAQHVGELMVHTDLYCVIHVMDGYTLLHDSSSTGPINETARRMGLTGVYGKMYVFCTSEPDGTRLADVDVETLAVLMHILRMGRPSHDVLEQVFSALDAWEEQTRAEAEEEENV